MQQIESLFKRKQVGKKFLAYDEVNDGCQWVLDGEGIATVKHDGTACRILNGALYRRHVIKEGRDVPAGWIHWSDNLEQRSGHGWLPVADHPNDQYHMEAFSEGMQDGTYELCGPKIQNNPEGLMGHRLIRHGSIIAPAIQLTFDAIRHYLAAVSVEGIVWHHADGRMVKIKRRDFGIQWPPA